MMTSQIGNTEHGDSHAFDGEHAPLACPVWRLAKTASGFGRKSATRLAEAYGGARGRRFQRASRVRSPLLKKSTMKSNIPILKREISYRAPKIPEKIQPSTLNPQPRSAFTLIELLVVIGIIALLAGLLMPALGGAKTAAKKAKAKSAINILSIALKAYYNEYGTWPHDGTGIPPLGQLNPQQNEYLQQMLSGRDIDLAGNEPSTPGGGGNPRLIPFMEFKQEDLREVNAAYSLSPGSGVFNFVDPWNISYLISFDEDGNNQVNIPGYTSTALPPAPPLFVNGGFAIISGGPDVLIDPADPWHTQPANRDNITNR